MELRTCSQRLGTAENGKSGEHSGASGSDCSGKDGSFPSAWAKGGWSARLQCVYTLRVPRDAGGEGRRGQGWLEGELGLLQRPSSAGLELTLGPGPGPGPGPC